jgi:hypothetical protein
MFTVSVGRFLSAVIGTYLAFGLTVTATEQVLSLAAVNNSPRSPLYFLADVILQCVFLIAAGYLCSVIARSSDRLAVMFLTVLGLLVGTLSLITSWKSEPHWYGITLLVTYGPCLWAGWASRKVAGRKLRKRVLGSPVPFTRN